MISLDIKSEPLELYNHLKMTLSSVEVSPSDSNSSFENRILLFSVLEQNEKNTIVYSFFSELSFDETGVVGIGSAELMREYQDSLTLKSQEVKQNYQFEVYESKHRNLINIYCTNLNKASVTSAIKDLMRVADTDQESIVYSLLESNNVELCALYANLWMDCHEALAIVDSDVDTTANFKLNYKIDEFFEFDFRGNLTNATRRLTLHLKPQDLGIEDILKSNSQVVLQSLQKDELTLKVIDEQIGNSRTYHRSYINYSRTN